jgi:cell shape-determining protein MreC
MSGGASLATILAQTQRLSEENRQLKAEIQKTQQMVQSIIDALRPGRKR